MFKKSIFLSSFISCLTWYLQLVPLSIFAFHVLMTLVRYYCLLYLTFYLFTVWLSTSFIFLLLLRETLIFAVVDYFYHFCFCFCLSLCWCLWLCLCWCEFKRIVLCTKCILVNLISFSVFKELIVRTFDIWF